MNSMQKGSLSTPYPLINYITCNNFCLSYRTFLPGITKILEPMYYHEAVRDPRWCKAMAEEIHAFDENQTWTFEDLPPGKKLINCK